jgi:hypothetical protein
MIDAPRGCHADRQGQGSGLGGTMIRLARCSAPQMEAAMCHSRDWWAYEERQKQEAKERQAAEERRAGLIQDLLADAEKQAETTKCEPAPIKEAAPAK